MRKALISFALSAAAGAAAITAASAADKPRNSQQRLEERLQKELAQLKPQAPVECIDTRFRNISLTAIGNKLIYRESRNKIYVSDTTGGCENVARGDVLVTRQFGTRLCRGDIATTMDRVGRFYTGSCAIGTFTPYTKG
ncbi:hypothetical protein ACH0CP_00620 [Sphingomonas sp. 179-I 2A4 NHS]|jgi:hypothetical protein|uniref:hypothetical protein n=1 Tax=unclassified Sphingomonas TaxID=196159 RepID=UPI003879B742